MAKDARVNQLMKEKSYSRNEELIRGIFNSEDAQAICKIPLSRWGMEDRLMWNPSHNGLFTVISTYVLAHTREIEKKVEPSYLGEMEKRWKSIWRIEVQGSVKHFLWKATNNLLPTRDNLVKKRVIENDVCPIYEKEKETTIHALWTCLGANDVLAEKGSPLKKLVSLEVDFMKLRQKLSSSSQQKEMDLIAIIMRRIWLRRNSLIFYKKFKHPKTLLRGALLEMDEYTQCQQRNKL